MRKLFWIFVLFGAYVWMVTTGHEQWVFDQGKHISQMITGWFKSADVDFQTDSSVQKNKRSHRWD